MTFTVVFLFEMPAVSWRREGQEHSMLTEKMNDNQDNPEGLRSC